LEDCTAESGCQAGSEAHGPGQINGVWGIAVDQEGDIFVREGADGNSRIQKFSPSGRFLLAVGGEVNKTKSEQAGSGEAERNLCTAASGDVCQEGIPGTGDGKFESGFSAAVIGSTLYVGGKERIQTFNLEGEYEGDLADPEGLLAGKTVRSMVADPQNERLYIVLQGEGAVTALDSATGKQVGAPRQVIGAEQVAADPDGNLFAIEAEFEFPPPPRKPKHLPEYVTEFGSEGERLIPDQQEEKECETIEKTGMTEQKCPLFATPVFATPEMGKGYVLPGIGTGPAGDLYVGYVKNGVDAFVRGFGPPPVSFESPPAAAPTIDGEYASSVTDTDAQLRVVVNPHFFSGALGTTTYRVQFGTASCVEAGGWAAACVSETPEANLSAGIVDEEVTSAPVTLSGLTPKTEYRYRFVVEGSGAPGAPVEGEPASFRTHVASSEGVAATCGNEAFRGGPSGTLPDCRAYEMVSPIDKEGGEIRTLFTSKQGLGLAALDQASAAGDKLSYGSYRPFGGAVSAPYTSQYIAIRGTTGWENVPISPPKTTQILPPSKGFDTEFRLFSEDLCESWLQTFAEPVLSAAAVPGYSNLYRHSLCPAPGAYEALTTVSPSTAPPAYKFEPELQGLAADGTLSAFTAIGKLTPDAPTLSGFLSTQLYVHRNGESQPRFVCIGPEGVPIALPCGAGSLPKEIGGKNRTERIEHALSSDGRRLYWSDEKGHIYLRVNPAEAQSAQTRGYANGTGRLKAGETQVTQLVAAEGEAEIEAGSTKAVVTKTVVGRFVPGQVLKTVAGIAAGTTVEAVENEGPNVVLTLSQPATATRPATAEEPQAILSSAGPAPFEPGQEVTGLGVAPGTTIEAATSGELTLSKPATQSGFKKLLHATSPCEAGKSCTLAVSQIA